MASCTARTTTCSGGTAGGSASATPDRPSWPRSGPRSPTDGPDSAEPGGPARPRSSSGGRCATASARWSGMDELTTNTTPTDPAELGSLAGELARAHAMMIGFYRRELGLSDDEADARMRGDD